MGTTQEALEHYFSHRPNATREDVGYFVYVTDSIDRGFLDVAAGETISHEDVWTRLRTRWGMRLAK